MCEEIRECPFCRSREEELESHSDQCWARLIVEEVDGKRTPSWEEYDKAWNSRPTEEDQAKRIKELEEALERLIKEVSKHYFLSCRVASVMVDAQKALHTDGEATCQKP